MSDLLKIPAAWVFRGVLIVVTLIQAYGVLWIKQNTVSRGEFEHFAQQYVSKEQYASDRKAHEDWGAQVIKRLEEKVDETNKRLSRIEAKQDAGK